jgi:carbonic anhydrase
VSGARGSGGLDVVAAARLVRDGSFMIKEQEMKTNRRIRGIAPEVGYLTIAICVAACVAAVAQTPLSPDDVIAVLKKGNERFAADRPSYPHESLMRRVEAAGGQHPVATVISCSDSRVPPELLFDEGIGDLFIVRVIGNIGGADETGSAEYGVEHLGTPVLLVLGHTGCGAVTAAVNHTEVHGSIPPLLAHIEPAVETARSAHPELTGGELIPEAVKANIFHSIEELFKRSDAIRRRVQTRKLKVVGALYNLTSGRVDWLGEHPGQEALAGRRKG